MPTKAGKKRHKGRQGKAQMQASKGAKAGNERHKGRQGKAQDHKSRQGKPKFKIKIINPINLYRRG
jgi:hypothetical protein